MLRRILTRFWVRDRHQASCSLKNARDSGREMGIVLLLWQIYPSQGSPNLQMFYGHLAFGCDQAGQLAETMDYWAKPSIFDGPGRRGAAWEKWTGMPGEPAVH